MKKRIFILLTSLFFFGKIFSQNCSTMNIQWQADIASTCNFGVMTMIHDANNQPYLYVANKEAGLKVYNISSIATPSLVATVPTILFDTLDVMNVSQSGNYLYLAIGNHFTNPQKGGMAIVDITNPSSPALTGYYVVPNSNSGGGIVKVEGNYAYLGANKSGLIILDITNKNNIQFISQFVPDINYPVTNPNPDLYNARGMEVKNSIVYLCYDAGGFRIINCTNKNSPVETGRYANPALYQPFNLPRAYNNIVLDDTLVYIAVDYCGIEVLNISDTSNIELRGWWNPYNCPDNNWFSSPVHSNEIHYDKNCKTLFISTGKSDMVAVDVSNPAQPDSCNFYGGVSNSIGTWGVGGYRNQIYLSYICTFGVPFASNWTGVKILTYDTCAATGINEQENGGQFSVYPNPASEKFTIEFSSPGNNNYTIELIDLSGRIVFSAEIRNPKSEINLNLSSGMYFYQVKDNRQFMSSGKFIVE